MTMLSKYKPFLLIFGRVLMGREVMAWYKSLLTVIWAWEDSIAYADSS